MLRKVPTLNLQTTNANALKRRQDLEDEVCLQAAQADDPWLLFLTNEYVGKICFLHDIAERHKLYRVCNIAYWTSNKTRYSNWEATLEPVHLMPSGLFEVADEDTILGPRGILLTKSKVLLGYILAQYIDGDDEEPTRSECVDLYIENAIDKLKTYVFKLQQIKRLKLSKGMRPYCYILIININIIMTYTSFHQLYPTPQMAPKKKQSLAVSRRKIEAERVNVDLRTTARIAQLYADAGRSSELVLKDWYGCLNTSCFFLTLLCMILLYCHWLAIPKEYCNCNQSIIYGFDIGGKN